MLLWACDGAADQLWSFESVCPAADLPASRTRVSEPPHPMEEERFRALVAAVRDASFSDSQLTVIQQAVTRNYLRVGQIKNLIDLVAFSATKLRVLELGASRIVDPENAFTVYDAFAFGADKAQARQILRRNGLSSPSCRGAGPRAVAGAVRRNDRLPAPGGLGKLLN